MSSHSLTATTVISLITLCLASLNTHAAKPMTEGDLGNVSAETGDNILNYFGAPAAGLTIDSDGSQEEFEPQASEQHDTYKEGETTEVFAIEEIKSLEENSKSQTNLLTEEVNIGAFEEAIYASKQTIGVATSLEFSNSEIKYLDKNVHHDLTVISNDNIKVSRDMHIDILKVDKLNTTENGPSAGSIYLSDWNSQGSTTVKSR